MAWHGMVYQINIGTAANSSSSGSAHEERRCRIKTTAELVE